VSPGLRTIGFRELGCRGRQELRKRLERSGLADPSRGSALGVFSELAATAELAAIREQARAGDLRGASRLLFTRFCARAPARFFEGPTAMPEAEPGDRRVADEGGRLLADAESICRGRFDLLGYRALFFGDPVDWHLDPVSRRRAPLVHWSRLDPLDARRIGDSKVIWELNRHQWLVRLGQAYCLTRDERYAERFAAGVLEWMRSNPPELGINWASSLEVAFRIVAWSWALLLFLGSRALSPEVFAEMLESISAHASHVERYLSYYFSPNTHLTGEALGLFYAGTVFPELRGARRWRRLGQRILVAESARQVLDDGVYFERATCYQRYTAEIYLHFLVLARRNGLDVPADVSERLERMLDFLLAVRGPDGSMPQIGDADGGWLLPLAARAPDDLRGLFAEAAAVFPRPAYVWAAGAAAPETLWMFGPSATKTVQTVTPQPPDRPPSQLFADGGYVVMRSGWDRGAHQLLFDVGPLGCPVSGGHGHADLLSIQCVAFGEPYLVDPGTYCYTAEPDWRDFFRSTAAHSTVMIDGLDQALTRGPFGWQTRPAASLRQWKTSPTIDVAEAEHTAYGQLTHPVGHRRRVLWVKPRFWVIVDELEGSGEHEVELRFQFAPLEVTVAPDLWARARGARGHGLLLRPFAKARLTAEVLAGVPSPIQGWVSPDYGLRRAAPTLVYSAVVTRLPLRIATLLYPVEQPLASPPPVVTLTGASGVEALLIDGERIEL